MQGRVLAATLTTIAITVVLLFVGAGLLSLDSAESPAAAFFDQGPRALVGVVGIPFLVWVAALVATDHLTRRLALAPRLLIGIGVTVVIALIAVVFWALVAGAAGGFAALLVAIALIYIALFTVAAIVALLVSHLVLFRPRPAMGAAAV